MPVGEILDFVGEVEVNNHYKIKSQHLEIRNSVHFHLMAFFIEEVFRHR